MQRRETERQHEQRVNSYAFLAARELEEPWASLQVPRIPLPCWGCSLALLLCRVPSPFCASHA